MRPLWYVFLLLLVVGCAAPPEAPASTVASPASVSTVSPAPPAPPLAVQDSSGVEVSNSDEHDSQNLDRKLEAASASLPATSDVPEAPEAPEGPSTQLPSEKNVGPYAKLPGSRVREAQKLLKTKDLSSLNKSAVQNLYSYFVAGWTRMVAMDVGKVPHYLSVPKTYFQQVHARLPEFVGTPLVSQFADKVESKRLAAYLIYGANRSPQNLQRMFSWFKHDPYRYVSKNDYIRHKLHHTVDRLLNIYQRFSAFDTFDEYLSLYYVLLERRDRTAHRSSALSPWSNGAAKTDKRLSELTENYQRVLNELEGNKYFERTGLQGGAPLYWGLSFWARRRHEGNLETVLKILKELQQLYRPAVNRYRRIENYGKTVLSHSDYQSIHPTSDHDIVPYGFGPDGSFYFCDEYLSSTATGADHVRLTKLTPSNKRVELSSVEGVLPEEHPLLAIMLISQVDWVKKLTAMKVKPGNIQLHALPFFRHKKKYDFFITATDASSTAALWLRVNEKKEKLLNRFEVRGHGTCENRAQCLGVRGYFRSPRGDRMVVVVTNYVGWENVEYHLLSIPVYAFK